MDQEKEIKNMGWNFDNSYMKLPKFFFSEIDMNPVNNPEMVIFNYALADYLGLNEEFLTSQEGIEILSGSKKINEGSYIAQAYCGHQFGYLNKLGDGRALLIGEQITPFGTRYDIQLKGSGRTPYSRSGDGRAVLGPMLREYIISEAMHNLGIPTTRSLAVVKTNKPVIREFVKQGAVLTRVASSHLRFGTFEYAYHLGDKKEVKALADYAIKRHYPKIKDDENKYLNFLKEVIKVQASLVAKWQSVGFIHGVMNTDNMTISGETIDYGPCAFMDTYDVDTVFSSIDTQGRYSYKNQPIMAEWNLCRFAETLLPLLHENQEEAIKIAEEAISDFREEYLSNWIAIMRGKLGLFNEEALDKAIIEDLLSMMQKYMADYTNTFLSITFGENIDNNPMFDSTEYANWKNTWEERLTRQPQSREDAKELMKDYNPAVIPRNHRVEEALKAADKGDYTVMKKLLHILSNPYEHNEAQREYRDLPKPSNCPYRTFCGT